MSFIKSLQKTQNECNKVIVDKLFEECVEMGASKAMVKEVCDAFEESFK
jgi:hypothetical protein